MKGFRRRTAVALLPCWRLLFHLLLHSFRPFAPEQVQDLPQPTDYVSDFAHVLSPEAIAQLDSICAQLDHSQANAQIAVVTVHTLNGDDAADYANQLEDKWKMGKQGRRPRRPGAAGRRRPQVPHRGRLRP